MVATGAQRREQSFVEDSYDESMDPDYTISNTVVLSDEDEDYDEDKLSDVEEEEEEGEDTEELKKESPEVIKQVHTLPYHNFHSFIHKHEIPRKTLHSSIGFLTLYLHSQGFRTQNVWRHLLVACAVITAIDLVRFRWKAFNRAYGRVVGFLMREKEVDGVNGIIWYLLGCSFALGLFNQDVGVLSVLLLSWCDTAASTIGRAYGKYSPKIARGKSLVGSFAAFITGVIACYLFYGVVVAKYPQYTIGFEYDPHTNALGLHTMALSCGFIAALSEGIDIWNFDDNLTIPVLSSIFLKAVIDLGKAAV